MDGETIASVGFMLFGLGFFLFITHLIEKSSDKAYERKLNEAREFGYYQSGLNDDSIKSILEKKKK